MRAEELMIGDWVQNPLGAPYQVLAIHFYKINGDGDGYYGIHLKNKGAEARLEIYDLHPVPLTPEILEKNGFKKQAFEGWEFDGYYENSGLVYQVLWRNDYSTPHLMINSFSREYGSYSSFNISSLHQLQHALRLVGIEKEVVL